MQQQRTQSISKALFQLLVLGILVPAALIWAIGHVTAKSAVAELWQELSQDQCFRLKLTAVQIVANF